MRVLFVTQYGELAASSRTRVFQYLPFLQQQGVDTRVITVLPDRAIGGSQIGVTDQPLRKIGYYLWALWRTWISGVQAWWLGRASDVFFIQKVIFPAPVRWLLRRACVPIVYDFDDAIFTTEVRSGHWLAQLKEARNASGVPAMLALAQLAVVENDYNGGFAAAWCSVLTITGPIDTTLFDQVDAHAGKQPRAPVILGWIGSRSTIAYLDLIAPVLQRLAAEVDLSLHVIGADYKLAGVHVRCKPWSLAGEATDLAACDIGLMPLPDDPWTRGKGGYKLLQYMACALPVVAHPVGVNAEIVENDTTGYLATDEFAWEEALRRLIGDADLRARLGAQGRRRVEMRYALRAQQPRLLAALQDLVVAA